jgi:hypothetical protein
MPEERSSASLSRPLNSSLLYQEHKKVPPGAQAARMDDLGAFLIRPPSYGLRAESAVWSISRTA